MSLSLSYDGTLSRVRAAITALAAADTFARIVANGWGTADSGQAWSITAGTAADFATDGTRATMTHSAVSTVHSIVLPLGIVDVDAVLHADTNIGFLTGGNLVSFVDFRRVDASNYYRLYVRWKQASNTATAELVRVLAGTPTTIAAEATIPGVTSTSGLTVHVQAFGKVDADGVSVRANAWLTGTPEPDWLLSALDFTIDAPSDLQLGSYRDTGNTNNPTLFRFDNVTVTPTVRLERSTDQLRWTTVRGGTAILVPLGGITVDDCEFVADVANTYRILVTTAQITPVLGAVWVKSIAMPFLNRRVAVADHSEVGRAARSGIFEVVGRREPVAVTEVHGSRRWTLDVRCDDAVDADVLDLMVATGGVVFVHVPAAGGLADVPGGHYALGDTRWRKLYGDNEVSVLSLPLTEVAPPAGDVAGVTVTCQGILNRFLTCTALLAACPTCADVLALVNAPADAVIA